MYKESQILPFSLTDFHLCSFIELYFSLSMQFTFLCVVFWSLRILYWILNILESLMCWVTLCPRPYTVPYPKETVNKLMLKNSIYLNHYCSNWRQSVQFSCSVVRPTVCNPKDCSMTGFPVHHQLPKLAQTDVHWVGDAIQPSHSLLSPSLPAFNLSQHQSLFQWVSSSHQVAKVLELQFQHQSFQWTFRTDFL